MSLNTLETAYVNGQIIDASHVNELTLSLLGSFVGRDSSGIPSPSQSLGTLALPWGNLYADGIILDGAAIDTSQIVSLPNRVVSGKTRTLSNAPDFLRANGAALSFGILGASDNLVLSINNAAVSISTDITKTGVTAAPSSNNTATVNDTLISNDLYIGEDERNITIDAVGSEISSKVGQVAAFQTPTGEIFKALIRDATTLSNVYRGFYIDETGAAIKRANLSNNDTLTMLKIGWVFAEDNGTTVDVSYTTPVVSYSAPDSPSTGDYWFDVSNAVWKRYSGASFEIINRMLIGEIVSDDTNTIATRAADFSKSYSEQNNVSLVLSSNEIIESKDLSGRVSVYGNEIIFDNTKLVWNITTDLESGLTETSSTYYQLYVSDEGQTFISDQRPHDRKDLKGKYHPYESWRFIGECFNDSSNDIISALSEIDTIKLYAKTESGQSISTSGTDILFDEIDEDNSGGYLESSGLFEIRRTGAYTISPKLRIDASTSSITLNILDEDDVILSRIRERGVSNNYNAAFTDTLFLKFGEKIKINAITSTGGNMAALQGYNSVAIIGGK